MQTAGALWGLLNPAVKRISDSEDSSKQKKQITTYLILKNEISYLAVEVNSLTELMLNKWMYGEINIISCKRHLR